MNIFVIAYIDLDKNGGQATHLREIVNNLDKLNNDITLLCPKFRHKDSINCSRIIEIPVLRKRQIINTIMFQYLFSISMTLYILRHNVDIIYIRHSQFNILPLLISRLMRIPCIIEINYSIPELRMLMPNIIIYMIKVIDKLSFNLANSIIAVANDLKDEISTTYRISNKKIFVISNGADIDKFRPIAPNDARELLRLNNDLKYICYIGGMTRWQGLEFLVKSAPIILEQEQNVRFLMVGKGNYLSNIMDLTEKIGVKKNFIFIHGAPHEKVPIYINAGDICVAPFYKGRIASPIKIYEYMACGKPIIASNISDIGSLLEKSSAGISIPPNDDILLAENIIKLLKDEKLRDIMSKNARKYIIENCTWEITAKRVLDVCTMEIDKMDRQR